MIERVDSGIRGLDTIMYGGFLRGSVTILEGEPGTGKTTVGLQFLAEGAIRSGEAGIFITFEQLPEQIYADAASFGWDLRALETRNLIRIVSMEPDVLFEQMRQPGGLFERLTNQLNCRRIVIDSISLFRVSADPEQARASVYTIRNILRKLNLTSLLIREYSGYESQYAPFENNVCDGIIRLSLQPHMEKYRKRTIEVLKMRGTRIMEGEHHFTFTREGIHVIPALSMAEEKMISASADMLTTGIEGLDELLGGGLPRGSVFMVDTNSKANHRYLVMSMFVERLKAGDHTVSLMTSSSTIQGMTEISNLFGVSLEDAIRNKQSFFIEHYRKPVPEGFETSILNVGGLEGEEYEAAFEEWFRPIFLHGKEKGKGWFFYFDVNTVVSERGKAFVLRFYADIAVKCRMAGITVVAHANFTELGAETSSFLERSSDGVIRTWVDGKYQYLQVTKSPTGRMSAPRIIENIDARPFIRLV